MRVHSRYSGLVILLLLVLFAALPANAAVFYQCPANLLTQNATSGVCSPAPCYLDVRNPANSSDPGCKDETSPTFFDTCKPLIDPVTGQPSGATTDPNVVCRSITCGDGHVYMADRDTSGINPDQGDTYIFGFKDVTGVPENLIMTAGMPASGLAGGAQFSAPTFFAREGQTLYLNLTNASFRERPDLFDSHTIHYHGFPNAAPVFDGEPMASFGINMGNTLTYYYQNIFPGTYMWHCHVEAAEHMQMGMLGNLFILPKQDGTSVEYPVGSGKIHNKFAFDDCSGTCSITTTQSCKVNADCPAGQVCNGVPTSMCGSTGYDVTYFLQETGFDPVFHNADHTYNPVNFAGMNDTYMLLNGRGYPDTVDPNVIPNINGEPSQPMPAIPMLNGIPATITHGQKVLVRLSSLVTTDFFSMTVLGIPMRVVGQGAQPLRGPTGTNTSYATNSVMLGGGEAVDIILDTTNVAPGTYFIYTTNLNHLSNNTEDFGGMMTEIVVN